jgi:hypothetical protein
MDINETLRLFHLRVEASRATADLTLNEYFESLRQRGNRAPTKRERARISELVQKEEFPAFWEAIARRSPPEREPALSQLIQIATHTPRKRYPVPDQIASVMLENSSDTDLAGEIHGLVCMWIALGGAWNKKPARFANLFQRLPQGLRLAYTLVLLNGEISNGGFWQFCANSRGRISSETLADCFLVGATQRGKVLKRAIALWKPAQKRFDAAKGSDEKEREAWHIFDTKVEPKLDELDGAYYALEDSEPIWRLILAYLQKHPESVLVAKSRNERRKNRR